MQPTSAPAERAIEHDTGTEAWLRQTLEEVISHMRRLLDVTACAFVVVDWEERHIRPAAAWFSTQGVRDAFAPLLSRPYEPERAGLTEAVIEQGRALRIARFDDWPGAEALHERLLDRMPPDAAALTWNWYRTSTFVACPVRAPGDRTLGVLTIASNPQRPLTEDDLRVTEVFAELAGLALERSRLVEQEGRRARDEELLNRAAQEVSRSLDVDTVYRTIVDQAALLCGVPKVQLTRHEPATDELLVVAMVGYSERAARARRRIGQGRLGMVAASGEPYLSRTADEPDIAHWLVEHEGIRAFVHVPIKLGPRLFGVLTAAGTERGSCDESTLARLTAFAPTAAGALANALDFQRERRISHALTQGFVPGPPPRLADFDVGLLYEPAGQALSGGDLFGLWRMPSGDLAVLIGDVSGKGLEVAAASAMVRFFVEARTWDAQCPAEVLAQTNALVTGRLPDVMFVPAFLAIIDRETIRWCNAGHPRPVVLRADGSELELRGTGLPLGVEEDGRYTEEHAPFGPGDVLFAATDGLSEARRGGEQFGAARLPALLAQHGRALDPEELVAAMRREAEAWAPELSDDIVILALRRK
jgi:GAF domain-containing protein